jgi:hypothetical protein
MTQAWNSAICTQYREIGSYTGDPITTLPPSYKTFLCKSNFPEQLFPLKLQSNSENGFSNKCTPPAHYIQEPYIRCGELDEIYRRHDPAAQSHDFIPSTKMEPHHPVVETTEIVKNRSMNSQVNISSMGSTKNSIAESDSKANDTGTLSHNRLRYKRSSFPTKQGSNRKVSRKSVINIRHNDIEKSYRNRLNGNFKQLLTTLQTPIQKESNSLLQEEGSRRLTKSKILALARQKILALRIENQLLSENIKHLSRVLNAVPSWPDDGDFFGFTSS